MRFHGPMLSPRTPKALPPIRTGPQQVRYCLGRDRVQASAGLCRIRRCLEAYVAFQISGCQQQQQQQQHRRRRRQQPPVCLAQPAILRNAISLIMVYHDGTHATHAAGEAPAAHCSQHACSGGPADCGPLRQPAGASAELPWQRRRRRRQHRQWALGIRSQKRGESRCPPSSGLASGGRQRPWR